jgi:hypothetical protein
MSQKKPLAKGISFTHCEGNPSFTPADIIQDIERQKQTLAYLEKNDLLRAATCLFGLPEKDTYVYHAMTSVRLAEVQHIVGLGGVNGLHDWYRVNAATVCT